MARQRADSRVEALARFIKLTQNGDLKWHAEASTRDTGKHPDDRVDAVFTANYQGRALRLYERVYLRYDVAMGYPEQVWASEVILELIGLDDLSVWTFPQEASLYRVLYDLLHAVQYQRAEVKDFLDAVLDDF